MIDDDVLAEAWPLTPFDGAVGFARRLVLATLRLWGFELGDRADDVALLVSELLTNAFTHSGGQPVTLGLYASRSEHALTLDVLDGSSDHPKLRAVDDDAEHGRGLFIVDYLTMRPLDLAGNRPRKAGPGHTDPAHPAECRAAAGPAPADPGRPAPPPRLQLRHLSWANRRAPAPGEPPGTPSSRGRAGRRQPFEAPTAGQPPTSPPIQHCPRRIERTRAMSPCPADPPARGQRH